MLQLIVLLYILKTLCWLLGYVSRIVLGAIDGAYIEVSMLTTKKPKYHYRKGDISTNTLGVCSRDMNFKCVT